MIVLLYKMASLDLSFCFLNRRDRVTASGGEVGRLNTGGGTEVLLYIMLGTFSCLL